MKRDMDLIRQLLLRIETSEDKAALNFDIPGYPEKDIDYNLDLLISAGLVNGTGEGTFGGTYYVNVSGLTWQGHDFLDAVRSDSVWSAAGEVAQDAGLGLGGLTLEMAKSICVSIIEGKLGLGG